MQLYDHQKKIVADDPKKSGLWLGTGAGKTRTALSLAEGKTLVICPKTQRDDKNWEREVEKMGKTLDLTVMSKEDFRRDVDKLDRFDTVIVDEAHTLLGVTPNIRWVNRKPIPKCSQLFDKFKEYIEKYPPKRLYLATATIVKSPMTVWGAGVILGRFTFDSFYKFRDTFYIKLPMPGRMEIFAPKKDKATKERLAKVVKSLGYVGRLEDYFDVPDQVYHNEYVEMTTDQKKMIKEVALDYPDKIVQIGKRHQVENGVLNGDEYSEGQVIKDNKIDRIKDYADEFPKMIIFTKYTMQIKKIEEALKDKKVYVMTGATKDRGELLEKLKDEDEYVFIVQAQVSAGWELPDCPVILFASRTYSFVDYSQAIGRIQRANNIKKNLYINLITKGGVDEAVDKALDNKCDFDEQLFIKN